MPDPAQTDAEPLDGLDEEPLKPDFDNEEGDVGARREWFRKVMGTSRSTLAQ